MQNPLNPEKRKKKNNKRISDCTPDRAPTFILDTVDSWKQLFGWRVIAAEQIVMTMIAAMGNPAEFDTDTEVVQDLLLENRHFTPVFTPLHVIFLLKSNSRSKLNKTISCCFNCLAYLSHEQRLQWSTDKSFSLQGAKVIEWLMDWRRLEWLNVFASWDLGDRVYRTASKHINRKVMDKLGYVVKPADNKEGLITTMIVKMMWQRTAATSSL